MATRMARLELKVRFEGKRKIERYAWRVMHVGDSGARILAAGVRIGGVADAAAIERAAVGEQHAGPGVIGIGRVVGLVLGARVVAELRLAPLAIEEILNG